MRRSWIVLALLGALGCRSGEEVLAERTQRIRTHAAEAPPRAETTEEELARLGLVEVDDFEGEEVAVDEVAGELPADLEEPVIEDLATVEAALAAAEAAESGASMCDAAFDAIEAMAAEVRARDPEAVHPMPPRGSFLDACRRLPLAAQECLLPTYAVAHREECARAANAAPRADRERLERVLAGG